MSEKLEAVKKRLLSFLFERCQPERGDVFSWFDTHADEALAYALASPVVPAPEGEACPHDAYETDAAGQPVRCVDCGMAIASAASPVVPVGVSRKRVRLIVSSLINDFTQFPFVEREAFIDRKTDAILAALRPTDTGRE